MKNRLERLVIDFWAHRLTRPAHLAAMLLLWPISIFYRSGLRLHQAYLRLRARRLPACVISVGNLVVGGTGKTPVSLWIAEQLERQGRRTAILTRGYGRKSRRVMRVPDELSAQALEAYGDEPLLLASRSARIEVWVGRDRYQSGRCALSAGGADVLILDDGFQHLRLKRDFDLVLLDARHPFANGRLFPLGPLREHPCRLRRADALLFTSRSMDDLIRAEPRSRYLAPFEGPIFHCRLDFSTLCGNQGNTDFRLSISSLTGSKVVAFAGIARPEAFFRSLQDKGLDLQAALAFPDHHCYGRRDIVEILKKSRVHQARFLITTEKDWVRLPAWLRPVVLKAPLEVIMAEGGEEFHRYLDCLVEQTLEAKRHNAYYPQEDHC